MKFERNRVYCGDCVDVMGHFPTDSIACCITDPPYNYEFVGHKWDELEQRRRRSRIQDSRTLVKHLPYGSGLAGGVRNRRWYERNRQNDLDYRAWVQSWTDELFRICKAGAPVAVFNSNRSIAHVQVALENSGFYTRDLLVYRRKSGIPKGLNLQKKLQKMGHPEADAWAGWHSAFRNEWEAIVLVQKPLINNYWETLEQTRVGVFKTRTADGSFQSNILEGLDHKEASEKFDHCTVKPLGLIRRLLEMLLPRHPENVVLDPFCGSGTTLVAAQDLGHPFVGIERESTYIPLIEQRLDTARGQAS